MSQSVTSTHRSHSQDAQAVARLRWVGVMVAGGIVTGGIALLLALLLFSWRGATVIQLGGHGLRSAAGLAAAHHYQFRAFGEHGAWHARTSRRIRMRWGVLIWCDGFYWMVHWW